MLEKRTKSSSGRRGNHEGSYYYSKEKGLYRYRESYIGTDGKRNTKDLYDKTKEYLRKRVKKWHAEISDGTDSASGMTVESWIEEWLALKKPTIRQRTYDDYKRVMTKKVIPVLGKKQIAKLTVNDCQRMLNDYAATLSPGTVNDIRRRLKVMVRAAVEQGVISRDVAGMTRPIRSRKAKIIVLTETEMRRMLEVVDRGEYVFEGREKVQETASQIYNRHEFKVLIHLALNSGCRLGELLG